MHCQLEMLRKCLRRDIRSTLESLPSTLDKTYERILEEIPEKRREYAQRLFQFLVVSVRPFRVEELADILAFKFEAGMAPEFEDCHEADPEEALLSTCSTMIVIATVNMPLPPYGPARVVQFAHFSVQEFITSEHLQISLKSNVAQFHVIPGQAHTLLAHTCLSLLQSDVWIDECAINPPLAAYAVKHWDDHARFEGEPLEIKDAMEGLFNLDKPYFTRWVQQYNSHKSRLTDLEQLKAISLYYAAEFGFSKLTRHLSRLYAHCINVVLNQDGTALEAASSGGSLKTVKVLFEQGADVNAQGGVYENALQAAAYGGSLEIADFLLQHGADINAQGGCFGNALQAAAYQRSLEIVNFLLQYGANINAQGGQYGNALQAAALGGSLKIVDILLQHGANVNAQGGEYGNALQAAALRGSLEIVDFLLQHDADINAQGGQYGNALQAAVSRGSLKIVDILLQHGADVNAQGGWLGKALQAAVLRGSLEIVDILLQHGANVNAQDEWCRNALQIAHYIGVNSIIQLLLKHGAIVPE